MAIPLSGRAAILLLVVFFLPACAAFRGGREPDRVPALPKLGEAELIFRGNDVLWDFTLGRAIGDLWDRPLTPAAVEDAAFSLERYYRDRGFPFAEVEAALEWTAEAEPVVRFAIYEGPRPPVASVRFRGNRRFSGERLEQVLVLRKHRWWASSYLVEARIEEDRARLENLHAGAGYVDVRIEPEVSYRGYDPEARILWRIDEGRRYSMEAVEVEGNRAFDAAALRVAAGVPAGADFFPRRTVEVRENVERFYRDRGYAFARAIVRAEVDRERATARLVATVREGEPWRFGRLYVRGNVRTKSYIIEREIPLRRGQAFSGEVLRSGERRLYELGLFDRVSVSVEPAGDAGRRDEADVTVQVSERPAGALRVGGGWGSFEQLRGQVSVSYLNLLGRGIQGDARVSGSFRGFQAAAGLRDPFVLGTRLRSDIDAFYEDRDVKVFDIVRRGGTAFLSYPFAGRYPLVADRLEGLRVAAGARLERSSVTDFASGALVEDRTIDLVSAIVRLVHDGRDDPVDPRRGAYHEVGYEEAGVLGVGGADFSKLTAGAAYYVSPLAPVTLAVGVRGGIIYDHEGAPVPIQERFFLGGDTTVRGFVQNEIGAPSGGRIFLLGSAEARWEFFRPFAAAAFVDAGQVYGRLREVEIGDLRVTPGAGLRLRTPVGPLRLDVGFKADKKKGEDLAEVHFSVGYPF